MADQSKPGMRDMLARLSGAAVPRSCWSVSTTGTGRKPYRDFAEEVKERAMHREMQTSAYLQFTDMEGILDVEIVAKEMVLAGVRTRYTTFYKLMRDLRLQDSPLAEGEQPLSRVYAIGAIVMPNVPLISDIQEVDLRQYHETIEYMINHAYEGGVLVIAGGTPISKRYKSGWPPLFERLLLENSRIFKVT